jgi:hypothetical protein
LCIRNFLFINIFALSGCVNIYTYREDYKPLDTFYSSKPAQEVQECILSEWQQHPLGYPVTHQKTGKYFSVLGVSDNADSFEENGRTVVNFYSLRGSLDPWRGIKKNRSHKTLPVKSKDEPCSGRVFMSGENMIYTTGSIAVSGNTLTGTGTNFTAAGSLIRIGCTLVTLANPVQVFQITAINSATQLTVTPAATRPLQPVPLTLSC